MSGHRTCPHCRAIVQSTICTICGKTSFEEVAAPVERNLEKWWTKFENDEPKKVAITFAALALIGGITFFVLTRPDAAAVANELPPPAPPTSAAPSFEPQGEAPSLQNGLRPGLLIAPGAPREAGAGLSPWDTAPPIDIVSGGLLDLRVDYSTDIARVADLLSSLPSGWSLDALDPPELPTYGGMLEVASIETTQPFAARTITRKADGVAVGELWLVASSGSEPGDDYLAAARDRWDLDSAIEQFSPDVGVRLWRLGGDDGVNLWASDLDARSMVIIQAPATMDPLAITDALHAWRRAIVPG